MSSSTAELVKTKLLNLSVFLVNNQATLSSATCQQIYATLSIKHRSALRQFVSVRKWKSKKVNERKSCLQKLFHIESVESSLKLRDRIETWVKNFDFFFQDSVIAIETNHHSFFASFKRIAQSAETRKIATIRQRFDLESIYKRIVRSDHYTSTEWRNEESACLAQQLQRFSLISDDVEKIQGKLERYVELRRSWNLWVERLRSSGFFIVLSQTMIEEL